MSDNNVPVLKTENMENRIDKFVKSIDSIEDLAEQETVSAIQELLQMGTIRNWGAMVKMVFSEMKDQMSQKIEKVNSARDIVNK